MKSVRIFRRNMMAGLAIVLLFLFADFVEPKSHLQQAQLSCGGKVTVFANMDACTNYPGYRAGCGCGPVENPWYATYRWGLIPLLAGLLGAATLIGSLIRRLVFLNGAVVIALVAQSSIHALFNERYSSVDLAFNLLFFPLIAAALCVLVTAWFTVLRFSVRWTGSRSRAT